MTTKTITVTAAGASSAIPIDLKYFKYGIGLVVTIPAGSSATYDVEVTGDDPKGALTNWNPHDILKNKTASANSNLAYPVTAVRLNPDAITGSLTLAVVTAEG